MKMHLKSAAVGGAIAAVAVSGALIAGPVFANDSSGSTSSTPSATSTTPHAPDFDGDGPGWDTATVGTMGGRHGDGPMGGIMGGRMLHSEGVVATTASDGTVSYVTVRTQSGKVTAASDTSITVKSDDGYTRTWAITPTTVVHRNGATAKGSAFAVGDTVEVSGTVSGDTVTTAFVGSGGMGGHGGMGGRGGHGRMDGDGPNGAPSGTLAPVPSTTSSSTGTNA